MAWEGDRTGGCNKVGNSHRKWVCLFLPGGDWGKQQSVHRDCSTHLIVPECALKVCREQGKGEWCMGVAPCRPIHTKYRGLCFQRCLF